MGYGSFTYGDASFGSETQTTVTLSTNSASAQASGGDTAIDATLKEIIEISNFAIGAATGGQTSISGITKSATSSATASFDGGTIELDPFRAEWFGGQYLVTDNGSTVEIRDKNNSFNVVDSVNVTEDSIRRLDINNEGTKIIVGQQSSSGSGKTAEFSGQPEVYATGFSPGPNLGRIVQTNSSGVKQTNSSGVVLTQA